MLELGILVAKTSAMEVQSALKFLDSIKLVEDWSIGRVCQMVTPEPIYFKFLGFLRNTMSNTLLFVQISKSERIHWWRIVIHSTERNSGSDSAQKILGTSWEYIKLITGQKFLVLWSTLAYEMIINLLTWQLPMERREKLYEGKRLSKNWASGMLQFVGFFGVLHHC